MHKLILYLKSISVIFHSAEIVEEHPIIKTMICSLQSVLCCSGNAIFLLSEKITVKINMNLNLVLQTRNNYIFSSTKAAAHPDIFCLLQCIFFLLKIARPGKY